MAPTQNVKRTWFKLDRRARLFLFGALLAAAFFFIEAGISEIMIAVDQNCRATLATVRFAPDPFEACSPEWQWYLFRAIARGLPWVIRPEGVALVGWLVMGGFYATLGGVCARGFRSRGVIAFLIAQVGIVAALVGLGYFRQFIA